MPRTTQQCVDELIKDGFKGFVPPVRAWTLPEVTTNDPDIYWPMAYDALERHHKEETGALLAIIEELTKRARETAR